MDPRGARRLRLVDRHRGRRRIVQDQHDLGEQAMARREIDDAAAAEEPPCPPRDLPRFVELLARQTPGLRSQRSASPSPESKTPAPPRPAAIAQRQPAVVSDGENPIPAT